MGGEEEVMARGEDETGGDEEAGDEDEVEAAGEEEETGGEEETEGEDEKGSSDEEDFRSSPLLEEWIFCFFDGDRTAEGRDAFDPALCSFVSSISSCSCSSSESDGGSG